MSKAELSKTIHREKTLYSNRRPVYIQIVKRIYSDCETHLSNNSNLHIVGYHLFGLNWLYKHKNAPKTFSGVGIFVKDALFQDYKIEVGFKLNGRPKRGNKTDSQE